MLLKTRVRESNTPLSTMSSFDPVDPEVSVVLPCRNEEEGLTRCLAVIARTAAEHRLAIEVVVSDSSSDGSPEIAGRYGAILVRHNLDGYGNACIEGCRMARGEYLFIADADASYDFSELPKFISALRDGYDFVVGDRFAGTMEGGAMPLLHRYVGNPLLSTTIRVLFKTPVRDSQCGMRAITRAAFQRLNLVAPGMEFASEMVIKAARCRLKTKALPINYHQRLGTSKLRPINDGGRHLMTILKHFMSRRQLI